MSTVGDILRTMIGLEYDETDALHAKLGETIFRLGQNATYGQRIVALRFDSAWELRDAGGTSDVTVGSVSNGVLLCGSGTTGCHGYFEKRRTLGLELGLLISRNATTAAFAPAAVRVRREDGSWWLLTESGRAVEIEEGMPS